MQDEDQPSHQDSSKPAEETADQALQGTATDSADGTADSSTEPSTAEEKVEGKEEASNHPVDTPGVRLVLSSNTTDLTHFGQRKERRIIGRSPDERPRYAPIQESQVPLFVPAKTEPVVVKNAFAVRMLRLFWLPTVVLIGIAILVVLLFRTAEKGERDLYRQAQERERLIQSTSKEKDGTTILRADSSPNIHAPRKDVSLRLENLRPADNLPSKAAEQAVRDFLNGSSFDEKIELVLEKGRLGPDYLRNYSRNRVEQIPFRRVQCIGRVTHEDRVIYVVEATLFDHSVRTYQVHEKDRNYLLAIRHPEEFFN